MSPVSACASKCSIETRPWPSDVATPVASGKAIEWSPPSTTGIAPARGDRRDRGLERRQRRLDVAGVHLDVAGVEHPQVLQAVGAQRQAAAGTRRAAGSRSSGSPAGRTGCPGRCEVPPSNGRAEDHDVRAGEGRRVVEVAPVDARGR